MKAASLPSRLALAFLLLASALAGTAQSAARRVPAVAILEISNAGLDPKVDYLSSIVQGILAFDIGSRPELALVDRRNLDAALKEKELSLSAVGDDADSAAAAGRLAGADWLVSGEYVFLGSDVLLTLSLTDAATAKRTVFRDRGPSENLVHKLAEQIVQRLTGKAVAFADPGRERSLVSLRDETPGSAALFSRIIRAEVFLDGEFIGYTTGDPTVPLILEKLSPGQHKVRVHLDSSFGVVKLPEVTFGDWEYAFDVQSDKRTTLRDQTAHFAQTLYSLMELGRETVRSRDDESTAASPAPKLAFAKDFGFQDRSGKDVAVRVEAKPRKTSDGLAVDIALSAGPKGSQPAQATLSLSLASSDDAEKAAEASAGIVVMSASLERRSGYWELDWRVERSDISQDMFR